ncbi:MAG: DUF1330 domain-containing protein [SAR202 cluster bacterium]|nr:DUF1330 domain-containing protein [SAR202 cluster bacterium]
MIDREQMQKYIPKAIETLNAQGGEGLALAENPTVLEGNPPFPRLIILKFASREAAMAWYESPEYQEILPLRHNATRGFALLVDGLDAAS